MNSRLPVHGLPSGRHAPTASFSLIDPWHNSFGILENLGSLCKALKRIACDLEGLVPVKRIATCFPCGLIDEVLLDFRPFFKEIDSVFESSNLSGNVFSVLHEYRTVKQFGVHHILQVGERLVSILQQPLSSAAIQKSVFEFSSLQEAESNFFEFGAA